MKSYAPKITRDERLTDRVGLEFYVEDPGGGYTPLLKWLDAFVKRERVCCPHLQFGWMRHAGSWSLDLLTDREHASDLDFYEKLVKEPRVADKD